MVWIIMAGECTGGLRGSHKSHLVACGRRHHKVTGMGMYPCLATCVYKQSESHGQDAATQWMHATGEKCL